MLTLFMSISGGVSWEDLQRFQLKVLLTVYRSYRGRKKSSEIFPYGRCCTTSTIPPPPPKSKKQTTLKAPILTTYGSADRGRAEAPGGRLATRRGADGLLHCDHRQALKELLQSRCSIIHRTLYNPCIPLYIANCCLPLFLCLNTSL